MLSKLLLILGALALTLCLRTFAHPLLQRLGAFGIVGCSFLAGYLLTGRWGIGLLCALSWVFLPWIDLLTRIRSLTLPIERTLRHRSPPRTENFPALPDLTEEIEAESFEYVDDSGWEMEQYQQFFRLFYRADERLQTAVCLVEQQDIAFFYVALSSREKNGTLWTTWNYPFSYSLQFAPQWRMNRLRGDLDFVQMLESHREFLRKNEVQLEALAALEPDSLPEELQKDFRDQIAHNLATGVLVEEKAGEVRYSWRGLFFLWLQFLRDLVRLS